MIYEIEHLMTGYYTWLQDKTQLRQVGKWVEITTPYLDRHNDYLQIYAKRSDEGIVLTDDGYTIGDLEQSGCKLESHKRKDLLMMTLRGFGVKLEGQALEVSASTDNFPLRKHNLVQAMLAVNDLFYLAMPMVTSLFYEDVMAWLDAYDVRYTPRVKFAGKSGFDNLFDFVIPKSRTKPERILRVVSNPSRDSAEGFIWAWMDTKEVRSAEARAYAVLNDSEKAISSVVSDALKAYEIRPLPWSQREDFQAELAA